ncbi:MULTISPECIES: c-type cytochrome [unclassified Pantoea]|uniref:c-type cytochrome n=1 Tax=unclassified Pantoea TaxID=2630326 RepID=UPI001CD5EE23|nr:MULTISPECIES: cytochrome c [unclassified Pantoea]MCA1179831.1 cytochrome c [Pantoea sp. alder69]MCA1253698.1 cytochrome c [Pantoea sp. alder70]MCA1268334.1 cytochrome c [Pantoea sp. alder81]
MKYWMAAMVLAAALPAFADGDVNAGAQKAATCLACHGAEGKSAVPLYPNLAGQHAPYLLHSLQAYKKGERSGGQAEVMKAFVAGLSDQDMEDLSAYYSSLKP